MANKLNSDVSIQCTVNFRTPKIILNDYNTKYFCLEQIATLLLAAFYNKFLYRFIEKSSINIVESCQQECYFV